MSKELDLSHTPEMCYSDFRKTDVPRLYKIDVGAFGSCRFYLCTECGQLYKKDVEGFCVAKLARLTVA